MPIISIFINFANNSMHRSEKFIQAATVNYKTLYIEQRKLKEQFQKRAELAELKLRKLSQTVNKKCVRCIKMEEKGCKNDKIKQFKQFKAGWSEKNIAYTPKKINLQKGPPLIENFAIFGAPQSMLADHSEYEDEIESQLLYISQFPTDIALHSAKLAFPNGILPKYFNGCNAREKSIEIMSSNCSFEKSFLMSFQSQQKQQQCELLKLMNPQNRLYAICIGIEDFTMVPYFPAKYFQSQKTMVDAKEVQNKLNLNSIKALSCDDTEATNNSEKQCHIATSQRVYCIFSKYPLFHFYQQLLKSILSSVKTERLVVYRQSGCTTAEADSHFFMQRIKLTFRQLVEQIDSWQTKLNKQLQLKLITCQRLSLSLYPDECKYNYIQQWGIPIFKLFTPQTFLDIFMLMLLEEKIVFVCENQSLLTYTIHLFTRLLVKPLNYPYPTVYLLPPKQQYLNSPFPVVYGYYSSKAKAIECELIQRYKNTYVFLNNEMPAEIISSSLNKSLTKKRPPKLLSFLTQTYKTLKGNHNRRQSSLKLTNNQHIEYVKDKTGICFQILKYFNRYIQEDVMSILPKPYEISQIRAQLIKSGINEQKGKDINHEIFKIVKDQCKNKGKDELFAALLDTQIVNVYLFP